MTLPDFFVIGAPKCGTTALHVALATHPQVFMSANKEPKHFNADGPPPRGGGPGDAATYAGYVWRRDDYEALFADAPAGTRKGESTTLYLADHGAHRRIADTLPQARLVAVVRDPVDRAHSNWMHLRAAGLEPEADFLRACDLEEQRARDGWGLFWRYQEQSRYGAHLEHLLSVFPREQVLVLLYRDLREEPAGTLDRITGFLGVQQGVIDAIPTANVTAEVSGSAVNEALAAAVRRGARAGSSLPGPLGRASTRATDALAKVLQREQHTRTPLTADQRAALLPRFSDDTLLLEELTGLDLAHWRDPGNGSTRRPLAVDGRFGTAYQSIDRPV